MISHIFDRYGWAVCEPYETASLPAEEYYPAIMQW